MFVWSDTRLYIRPVSWTCQHFAAHVWANRLSFFLSALCILSHFFPVSTAWPRCGPWPEAAEHVFLIEPHSGQRKRCWVTAQTLPCFISAGYLGASLPLEVLLLNPSLLYCKKKKKTMERAGYTGTVWTLVCVQSGHCSHIMKLEFCPVICFPWLHKLRLYHLRPTCIRAY